MKKVETNAFKIKLKTLYSDFAYRYILYALTKGRFDVAKLSNEEALDYKIQEYPTWIEEKKSIFKNTFGLSEHDWIGTKNQEEFDKWLERPLHKYDYELSSLLKQRFIKR